MKKTNIIHTINEYLEDSTYLEELCNLSNNNPADVYENMAKAINYYLVTNDPSTPLSTILKEDNKLLPNTIFTPSNTKYNKRIHIYDLNSEHIIPFHIRKLLIQLNEIIGIRLNFDYFESGIDLPYAIYRAINILPFYNLFIENPEEQTTYYVKEPPIKYYRRVLENKAKRLNITLTSEQILLFEQLMSCFVGERPCVYVIKYPQFFKKECIILPTIFRIINKCAENKGIETGVAIKPSYVKPISKEKKNKRRLSDMEITPVSYTRFERITIDENFKYHHDDLTGSSKEDMRLMYGREDYHNRFEILDRPLHDNINSIKTHNDIALHCKDGVYYIYNGRHRIVYMKYNYDLIYPYYGQNRISELKDIFSIPVKVTHYIKNPEFDELLSHLNGQAIVLKNNILDDELSIAIVTDHNIYFTRDINELRELISMLASNQYDNKYLYSTYEEISAINYDNILKRIYFHKKENFPKMTFKELLDLLPESIVKIIDPVSLYNGFTIAVNNQLRNELFHTECEIIPEKTKRSPYVLDKLINVILDNPNLLELPIEEIIKKLKEYEEFKDVEESIIIDIINKIGLRNTKENHTKKYQV